MNMKAELTFQEMIPQCFGFEGFQFALDSADAERAAEMLLRCVKEGVRLSELKQAVTDFLEREVKMETNHIADQLELVDKRFQAWLES